MRLINSGMTAEPFHRFVTTSLQLPSFPLIRPFDWQKLIMVVASLISFATLTKLAWPTLQKILQNKNVWAAGSLVYSHRTECVS
jgi:OST3 / OST6 family, transporter family